MHWSGKGRWEGMSVRVRPATLLFLFFFLVLMVLMLEANEMAMVETLPVGPVMAYRRSVGRYLFSCSALTAAHYFA